MVNCYKLKPNETKITLISRKFFHWTFEPVFRFSGLVANPKHHLVDPIRKNTDSTHRIWVFKNVKHPYLLFINPFKINYNNLCWLIFFKKNLFIIYHYVVHMPQCVWMSWRSCWTSDFHIVIRTTNFVRNRYYTLLNTGQLNIRLILQFIFILLFVQSEV